MKQKLIAALKTAYAKLGLSDEAFDGVASLLKKTVTEESQIATVIDGDDVKGLLKTIQGQVDSWKNKYHDKDKELKTYKESHPDTTPKKEGQGEGDEKNKAVLDELAALKARLDERDAKDRKAATLASVKALAKSSGCSDERVLKLTERMFALKDDESEEDAAKRFKDEYDANVKEFFGDGIAPLHADDSGEPAKVSAEDRAAKAREDAKRVGK